MLRLVLSGILWLAATAPGLAGAWLRSEGHGFYSITVSRLEIAETGRLHDDATLYFAYGVRDSMTGGISATWTEAFGGEVYGFLRWPLPAESPNTLAYEVGIGANTDPDETYPFVKTGFSAARRYWVGKQYGWMNVDMSVFWRGNGGSESFKIDGTIGLNVTNSVQIMGQALFEIDENDRSVTWVPSIIWALPGRPTRIALGYEDRRGRRESRGLRLGLWHDF